MSETRNGLATIMDSKGGGGPRKGRRRVMRTGSTTSRGGPPPHPGTILDYFSKMSSLKGVCNTNGKRPLDESMADNDSITVDDSMMVECGGADMKLIGMDLGTNTTQKLHGGGPKSGLRKKLTENSKKKLKLGIIDSKKIEDYFHFVGTNSQGK